MPELWNIVVRGEEVFYIRLQGRILDFHSKYKGEPPKRVLFLFCCPLLDVQLLIKIFLFFLSSQTTESRVD